MLRQIVALLVCILAEEIPEKRENEEIMEDVLDVAHMLPFLYLLPFKCKLMQPNDKLVEMVIRGIRNNDNSIRLSENQLRETILAFHKTIDSAKYFSLIDQDFTFEEESFLDPNTCKLSQPFLQKLLDVSKDYFRVHKNTLSLADRFMGSCLVAKKILDYLSPLTLDAWVTNNHIEEIENVVKIKHLADHIPSKDTKTFAEDMLESEEIKSLIPKKFLSQKVYIDVYKCRLNLMKPPVIPQGPSNQKIELILAAVPCALIVILLILTLILLICVCRHKKAQNSQYPSQYSDFDYPTGYKK